VLYTGQHLQLVLMTLAPGEEIGSEVHQDRDKFFRVEAGDGEITIDGTTDRVVADFAMIVPAGARHNVRSVGSTPLKLYTLYGPPEHRDGVVRRTRQTPTPRLNISTARPPLSGRSSARGRARRRAPSFADFYATLRPPETAVAVREPRPDRAS
jgi:mannose-6-phosphate isomerase-like protein (cupin superfamily)